MRSGTVGGWISVARPVAGSCSGSVASTSKSTWRSARRRKLCRARNLSRTRLLDPGATPTGRRIERSVDASAGIDEVQAATGEVVASVVDHELVRRPAPTAQQRLQHRDAAVVERADGDDRLGDGALVGVALGDHPHRHCGRARGVDGIAGGRTVTSITSREPPNSVTLGRVTVVHAADSPAGVIV